jgi:hypothetical protein
MIVVVLMGHMEKDDVDMLFRRLFLDESLTLFSDSSKENMEEIIGTLPLE